LATVARTGVDKSRDTLEYICDVVMGIDSEKHNLIFKEISLILQKFPSLLNSNLINRLNKFEDSTSSLAKGIIQDIRNDYNMQKIDRPQEKTDISKLLDNYKIQNRDKSGVTIVKVGGSKSDISSNKDIFKTDSESKSSMHALPSTGGRVELTNVIKHGGSEIGVLSDRISIANKDGSRSTGKLPTHRSMTRLNMHTSASRLESRLGLHKSMTRLDHRYNSNNTVITPIPANRSSITNSSFRPTSMSTYTAKTSMTNPSSGSPTKSMSNGSMSGLQENQGREVVTVDKQFIDQIHSEFARQSQQMSSLIFNRPQDFTRDSSLPPNTAPLSSSAAPLSLPSQSRRLPPYSSGPLAPAQPPSLPGGPPVSQISITNSNSQPLDLKTSYDRIASSRGLDQARSTFSNTLPSLRRRSHYVTPVSTSDGGDLSEGNSQGNKNRMSVFEPFPMRDTVQHFCEKHLDKIKAYMESVTVKLPLPVKCTIEERKGKKHAKLHFACQGRGDHCLYKTTFYTMKSRHPRSWIHLMFLALQSRSQSALSTRDSGVSSLKNCWEILKCEENSFSTLVTGAFPNARDQDSVIHELSSHRFFDVFEYNAPKLQWGCFLCNHPERASTFIADEEPVIEGQLKEKKGGKWRIFKKWKNRYFTLSGARLAYKEGETNGAGTKMTSALDVGSIRSVKVSKHGRNIPKAFEIFTADKTFILKAKDAQGAQEWVQCLTVAVAHSQAKDSTLRRLAYGGSLGRLNHGHGRAVNHYHSSLNSNLALRTAV